MNGVLLNVDTYHDGWYQKAVKIAAIVDTKPTKSRASVVSMFRSNTPADDVKTFYRRDITIPCLNSVSY